MELVGSRCSWFGSSALVPVLDLRRVGRAFDEIQELERTCWAVVVQEQVGAAFEVAFGAASVKAWKSVTWEDKWVLPVPVVARSTVVDPDVLADPDPDHGTAAFAAADLEVTGSGAVMVR